MSSPLLGYTAAGAMPLEALTGGGGEGHVSDSIKFPLDLDNTGHHVCFMAYSRQQAKSGGSGSVLAGARGERQINRKLASFYLPMPASLGAGYSATYQNEDIGLAGNFMAETAGKSFETIEKIATGLGNTLRNTLSGEFIAAGEAIMQTGKDLGTAYDQLAKKAGDELGSGEQRRAAIAGILAKNAGATAKTALNQIAGVAVNPHRVVLFQGTEYREHQFAYKLSPKSAQESQIITKIINGFKYYMHPRFGGPPGKGGSSPSGFTKRAFLDYPQLFEIQFRKEDRRHLFAFKTCVLKSFSAQYHPMGYPAYIKAQGESAPVEVDIQMTFQETEMYTKEDVDNETASVRASGNAAQLAFDESEPF